MKGLDDGPDGLNDRAWNRAMDDIGPSASRKRRAAAARQPIPSITEEVAIPQAADDNALIGHTEGQKLIDLFDAALLVDSSVMLHEHRRPGAIAALYSWAKPRKLKVDPHDLRKCGGSEIWHEIVLSPTHTIVVRERAA